MQIVDLALLVRKDSQARVDDPMAQLLPPVCVSRDNFAVVAAQPTTPPAEVCIHCFKRHRDTIRHRNNFFMQFMMVIYKLYFVP